MQKAIPIGISDYRKLKENEYYAVDKSMMIHEFLQRNHKVTFITRPRNFGKTLNMNMIAEFFDITKDSRSIFRNTAIMNTEYANQINSYPVIYLTFADAKLDLFHVKNYIKNRVIEEYVKYQDVFENLPSLRIPAYQSIVQKLSQNEPCLSIIMDAISFLSKCLEVHFHKKVILLIDEFDTPITEAHIRHFYDALPKNLILNDLSSFQYILLTGIQPFTNEVCSSFPYLNIYTVADQEYAQYFGFTQEETQRFLQYYGLNLTDEVKDMYEGYHIGDHVLYNPWSIINYADTRELNAYWTNTSTNNMIKDAIDHCDSIFKKEYESLILDGFIETTVIMKTSFFEQASSSSLWGLFVNAGYLTIQKKTDHSQYQLRIPNSDIQKYFISLTSHYLGISETTLINLYLALKTKKSATFLKTYREMLLSSVSYFDRNEENSYHTFLLGMCIILQRDYIVKSNQETGKVRADILLQAKRKDLPSYIIELKYTKDQHQDLNKLASKTIQQIEDNQYGHDLNDPLIYIGLAHHNKDVEMSWKERKPDLS